MLPRKHLPEPAWRTLPRPAYACPLDQKSSAEIPKLLGAYLVVGAKICGPPALDRQFKTIDFLTLMDLATMSERTRKRYFS